MMLGRQTVVLRGENRWGWPAVRLEFGPWYKRLWWCVVQGGKMHSTIYGEACVRFWHDGTYAAEGDPDA